MGLTKAWETSQDQWRLVGMKFPNGETELVLKDNPDLAFAETEIVVDDVQALYGKLSKNIGVKWIQAHVAVMQAPDGNVFVLIGE